MEVTIIGAGPAGASAALSALKEGASVALFDRSEFPRHKVCGEFLSPEVADLLESLGVWSDCAAAQPATLRRVFLALGERTKTWKLPEPARGLSRYRMDRILLDRAILNGARFRRETVAPNDFAVLAHGRHRAGTGKERLFGFKAHFTGPADDVMGLYFFDDVYVGINAVEGGRTNVCGVAPESLLRRFGFQVDGLLERSRRVTERLKPMARAMEWLNTGPLVFGPGPSPGNCYPAGDMVAFIDPFTGSGMLGAVSTGILAGRAAARGESPEQYRKHALKLLKGQHRAANLLRAAIRTGWAERLLPLIPGQWMFRATRPTLAG